MFYKIKTLIKRTLALVGLIHPSLGMKISSKAKAKILLEYKTSAIDIFVETGTEFGTMIEMIGSNFRQIYSIELDTELYDKAVQLFDTKKNVKLLQGDSAVEIKNILTEIKEPALFWLDAHGAGPMTVKDQRHCPVEKELQAIFAHPVSGHVILIDDARHFDIESISVIKKLAKTNGFIFVIKDGIFILYEK